MSLVTNMTRNYSMNLANRLKPFFQRSPWDKATNSESRLVMTPRTLLMEKLEPATTALATDGGSDVQWSQANPGNSRTGCSPVESDDFWWKCYNNRTFFKIWLKIFESCWASCPYDQRLQTVESFKIPKRFIKAT